MTPTDDAAVSCRTKTPYTTYAAAKRAWKQLRRQPGRRHLEIYKCRHCPRFHIGNPPGHQTYMRAGHPYTKGASSAPRT